MDRFMHINLDMEIGALFIIIFVWMDFTTDRTRETLKTGLSQKKKKKKKNSAQKHKNCIFSTLRPPQINSNQSLA